MTTEPGHRAPHVVRRGPRVTAMDAPPTIGGVHPGMDKLLTRRRAVDFCRVATALCRA